MTCNFDRDLLQEYALGEVDAARKNEVEIHLSSCAACRREVAFDREMARDLAALPEPPFPQKLEEVLVRASIQAFKAQGQRHPAVPSLARPRAVWPYVLGGLAGAGVLFLLVLLLWPGRVSSWAPVDQVVGGGVGQGLGILDGVLHLASDLRTGWEIVRAFLGRFSPIGKAMRTAFSGLGGSVWVGLFLGVFGSTFLLWRVTRAGQKRRVHDAKSHS